MPEKQLTGNEVKTLLICFLKIFINRLCYLKVAEYLISKGADVNLVNERGSSPLLAVCQYDNLSKASFHLNEFKCTS